MINTIIIDDEPRNIRMLSKMIEDYFPGLKIAGTADELVNARQLIEDLRPRLLLLDIEFPHGTVFSMLEKLQFRDFHVIFITAHNNYATEAFRQNTIDYILKPVTREALAAAVNRVETKLQQHAIADLSEIVNTLSTGINYSRRISLPSSEGILFVDEADIMRCEASGRYAILYLEKRGKIVITKVLKDIERMLNPHLFLRVHHSHIINLSRLVKYHKRDGGMAELADGTMIEVSSSRKEGLMRALVSRH
jgi:two-component system, LytTR family, response regulator